MTDLHEQHITKVSLGKAHCVALNNRGQIFSFGLNNKGQCGHLKGKGAAAALASSNTDTKNMKSSSNKNDMDSMCDVDEHNLIHGKCRICSICHESARFKLSSIPNPPNNASNEELYVYLMHIDNK